MMVSRGRPMATPESSPFFQHLDRTSRSFALVIRALAEPMRTELCLGYLLCRIFDTYEDALGVDAGHRIELLERAGRLLEALTGTEREFERALLDWQSAQDLDGRWPIARAQALGFTPDERLLLADGGRVWRSLRSLSPERRAVFPGALADMVRGMAEEVRVRQRDRDLSSRSIDETDRYCYFVAGTVGVMIARLSALEQAPSGDARARELAVAFGKALQLVNIIKDFRSDWLAGRCFWPGLRLPEGPGTALPPRESSDPALRTLLASFDRYAPLAEEYAVRMRAFRQDLFLNCALPLEMARRTLDLVRADPARVFAAEPVKLSREETFRIVTELGGQQLLASAAAEAAASSASAAATG